MRRRFIVKLLLVGAASLAFAVTAFSEGGFQSSISGWFTGAESRIWHDGNLDDRPTHVRFVKCTRAGGFGVNATINLRRVISLWPDDNKGDRTSYCATEDTVGWGRTTPAGDYRFKLQKINGSDSGYQLWVDFVGVAY
jgi:hypothetical protein